MNRNTIEKLKKNPHYKPLIGQFVPDDEDEAPVKTFGIPPAQHTIIPKHQTSPQVRVHKQK